MVEMLTYNIETRQIEFVKVTFPTYNKGQIYTEEIESIQQPKKRKPSPKSIYYKKAWEITLANDIDKLMNGLERGFHKYHIDHIIPISYGFKNNIPAERIGHISNLRPLHWKDNLRKAARYTPEIC